jgi:hypothetical protein
MSGPGKAGEALALRLAVEVDHPLACQLAGPVGHQHHGLLSLGSAGTVTCPTLGSGPHADITQRGSTWWKTPEAGAGRGGMAAVARRRWTRSTLESTAERALAGWTAGDGMAEPPTASPELAAAGARDELLASKVTLPRTRSDRLARSRLLRRLDEGMGRALVLVCTPAGFGKTTLLADWAAGATLPVAWLSLDPDDNDPAHFWRYVATALDRVVVGGLGEQLVPLLSPGSGVSSQGLVTALINQLEANPDEVALVLDDYHAIKSTAIHDSLGSLLTHLPPRLHWPSHLNPGHSPAGGSTSPTRVAGAGGLGSAGREDLHHRPVDTPVTDRWMPVASWCSTVGRSDHPAGFWEVSSDGGDVRRPADPSRQR